MSGGHFDYLQWRFDEIIEPVKDQIYHNDSDEKTEYGDKKYYGFKKETIDQFKEGVRFLELAQIYTQRIDWLLSGDDGEDSFHERLKEDLGKLE